MNRKEVAWECEDNARWITENQVNELTSLSLSTLRSHRFYGKGIPYSKIGRSVRYSLKDVLAFMESKKVTPRR